MGYWDALRHEYDSHLRRNWYSNCDDLEDLEHGFQSLEPNLGNPFGRTPPRTGSCRPWDGYFRPSSSSVIVGNDDGKEEEETTSITVCVRRGRLRKEPIN